MINRPSLFTVLGIVAGGDYGTVKSEQERSGPVLNFDKIWNGSTMPILFNIVPSNYSN